MLRIFVFKVFEAHTVCKKQEQKHRTVVKIWLEIPYGVCVCKQYVLVDKEPVRGTPNEKLSVTSVTYVQVRTISCCNTAEKLASTS